ncbi:MAG: hydrogenase expression/formation protein HypE [Candidatus Omnitrophota bacterium]|nr:hydrogenase expression/formation protein HypE [Candidatus Omnitrophota bacterium]
MVEKITLSHGSGGRLMHELVDNLILKELGNSVLREKKDSAIFKIGNRKTAFTTDSYVVNPLFFPGGDIGSMAVYGTVNDLSVCGARPLFISLSLIIEEGFDRALLEKIIKSVKLASKKAGVYVVTGDTKVVEKGSCDKIFINTSGIGEIYYDGLSVENIRQGDRIIISGPIGDHAISVLSKREGIEFKTKVKTDSAPLNDLIYRALKASKKVRFMRDPTRGGLATTLNEIARGAPFGISIDEGELPIRDGVREASELLGFDPLYLACEGRVVVIVAKEDEARALNAMRRHKDGKDAKAIGEISADYRGRVYLNTSAGGKRIVEMLSGEQLPRIC